MMVWLFAEKQSSIFIEFFNSIGTSTSFLHHPASDRFWPNSEAQVTLMSVCY